MLRAASPSLFLASRDGMLQFSLYSIFYLNVFSSPHYTSLLVLSSVLFEILRASFDRSCVVIVFVGHQG